MRSEEVGGADWNFLGRMDGSGMGHAFIHLPYRGGMGVSDRRNNILPGSCCSRHRGLDGGVVIMASTSNPRDLADIWINHGYCVEHIPRRGSGGHHRIIRDPKGRVVLQDAGHAGELEWIKDNLENSHVV